LIIKGDEEILCVGVVCIERVVIIEENIRKFYRGVLFEFRPNFHDAVIWTSQVAHDDPTLEVDCREQIGIGLLTAGG
jgi:hypothetical protein